MLNKGNIKIQGKIVKCVHLLSEKNPTHPTEKIWQKKYYPKKSVFTKFK